MGRLNEDGVWIGLDRRIVDILVDRGENPLFKFAELLLSPDDVPLTCLINI
jgi:hypothetical protein